MTKTVGGNEVSGPGDRIGNRVLCVFYLKYPIPHFPSTLCQALAGISWSLDRIQGQGFISVLTSRFFWERITWKGAHHMEESAWTPQQANRVICFRTCVIAAICLDDSLLLLMVRVAPLSQGLPVISVPAQCPVLSHDNS